MFNYDMTADVYLAECVLVSHSDSLQHEVMHLCWMTNRRSKEEVKL